MKKILYLIGAISIAIILTFPIDTITDAKEKESIINTEQTSTEFDLFSDQTQNKKQTETETETTNETVLEIEEKSENAIENSTETPELSHEDLIEIENQTDELVETEIFEESKKNDLTEPIENGVDEDDTTNETIQKQTDNYECETNTIEIVTDEQTNEIFTTEQPTVQQTEPTTELSAEAQIEEPTTTEPIVEETTTEIEPIPETQPQIEYINLSNYPKRQFYNSMNANEIKIASAILEEAEKVRYSTESEIKVTINELTTERNRGLYLSYIAIYLQRFPSSPRITTMLYESDTEVQIQINMDLYRERIAKREYIEREVEVALSTFTEGDERHKLRQIANWIGDRITYQSMQLEVYDALTTGYGNCNTYGLLFLHMAQRLGIRCDICLGNSDTGRHLWNRVILSDGTILFYDTCYYDGGRNGKWIAQPTSPWPEYILNDYY